MKINIIKYISYLGAVLFIAACSKTDYESGGKISTVIAMANIKALHNGDDVLLKKENLNGAYEIAGVVISDRTNGNFPANEIVVQSSYRGNITGLIFSFADDNSSIELGDSIKVNIDQTILSRKNGSLKISGNDFTVANVQKVSANNLVQPRVVNLINLYANFYTYESTLVQLEGMEFDNVINGQTFNGLVKFKTESSSNIQLSTLASATFADKALPLLADYIGIPTYFDPNSDHYNRAKTYLKLRNGDDVFNETGAPYLNFPETFESVSASQKPNYLMPEIDNIVEFKSGPWILYQSIIGDQSRYDRFNSLNGIQSIRMKDKLAGSAYLEMGFDLVEGASKVEVMHAIYGLYTSNPQVAAAWDLEYSQDGGNTWNKIGETVAETNTKNPSIVTFTMNIKGKVRFRINKLGYDGYLNGQNGMLNIDDFTVYQNAD